jgi:hypothetical protein
VAEEQKINNVNLKRTVTIKAIVTEDFKKYLAFECTTGIQNLEQNLKKVEFEGKNYLDKLETGKANNADKERVRTQIARDKTQISRMMLDLKKRLATAKDLKEGSLYQQGTIEGFTNVKIGENLYEKLGGVEIIVKDAIVQEIKKTELPQVKK